MRLLLKIQGNTMKHNVQSVTAPNPNFSLAISITKLTLLTSGIFALLFKKRMIFNSDHINKKRLRNDRLGRYIVTAFGGLVLLTLVILVSHLLSQAFPLSLTPTLDKVQKFALPDDANVAATGDVLGGQPLVLHAHPCRLSLYTNEQDSLRQIHDYIRPCNHTLSTTSLMGENGIVDVSPSGQVRMFPVRGLAVSEFNTSDEEVAVAAPAVMSLLLETQSAKLSFVLPEAIWQARQQWQFYLSSQWAVAKITTKDNIFVRWVNRHTPTHIVDKVFANATDVHPLGGAEMMLVISDGKLLLNRLSDDESQVDVLAVRANGSDTPFTLFSLEKDRTFFIQDANHLVSRWVLHRDSHQLGFMETYRVPLDNDEHLIDIKEHASINVLAAVTNKQRLLFINRVSGEVVSRIVLDYPVQHVAWFGDKLYGYDEENLYIWPVKYLSGITTWSSLFSEQHYEGYTEADTVWQTTSASDFQEAKFSITPLLIGSLKASLLALVIAIPVAIGAAIYSAFFAKSRLRHVIKPVIEMLEAIPSVLVGFIAAIWLAPKAEQFLFSFAFFLIVVPFALIIVALVQRRLADLMPSHLRHGAELGFTVVGILILGYISVEWAPYWLISVINIDAYALLSSGSDSPIGKTTIVVAIALGVAISPSIYSLAEDAISGVPDSLKHASFALGATRLQTLMYVVLHMALPGIMAAIMIGFGRAFGETMIVLMVTGNTPISSWGLIEGLRALTANLAIELPEADASSAHYQILFLTACILFVFTFIVNTLAELLRQHIRRRASYV